MPLVMSGLGPVAGRQAGRGRRAETLQLGLLHRRARHLRFRHPWVSAAKDCRCTDEEVVPQTCACVGVLGDVVLAGNTAWAVVVVHSAPGHWGGWPVRVWAGRAVCAHFAGVLHPDAHCGGTKVGRICIHHMDSGEGGR